MHSGVCIVFMMNDLDKLPVVQSRPIIALSCLIYLFVSDIFTNNDLRRIIQELSDEQERRLQTMLGFDESDIKKLCQYKDRRHRILEMVTMWLRRTYNQNKPQLAKQLSEYFNQITVGTIINGECDHILVVTRNIMFMTARRRACINAMHRGIYC